MPPVAPAGPRRLLRAGPARGFVHDITEGAHPSRSGRRGARSGPGPGRCARCTHGSEAGKAQLSRVPRRFRRITPRSCGLDPSRLAPAPFAACRACRHRDPFTFIPADCQEIAAGLSRAMRPGSVEKWFTTFRLVLDYASLDPNPARHRSVKLPSYQREEVTPPTAKQYLAILEEIGPVRHRLPRVLIEQTALRIGEVLDLTWGDIDVAGCQARLKRSQTRRGFHCGCRSPNGRWRSSSIRVRPTIGRQNGVCFRASPRGS